MFHLLDPLVLHLAFAVCSFGQLDTFVEPSPSKQPFGTVGIPWTVCCFQQQFAMDDFAGLAARPI